MTNNQVNERRIIFFSRYNLADQYDLAPEYRPMLEMLANRHHVMHLSFRGYKNPPRPPHRVQVQEIGPTFDRRSARSVLKNTLIMYCQLPKAARICRTFKPDLIFIPEILPMVGLLLHYFCRTRVATAYGDWHFHNMLANRWWSKPVLWFAELLDRFEVRHLNGFFCRATAAGERVQRWGVPAAAVRVVRDSPDPEAFSPRDSTELRTRCGFGPDDIVLSYHGVMHAGKGLDKLILWTSELARHYPEIGLMLIGTGPEEARLRQLAAQSCINTRIYFSGWLETLREVGNHINASDIGVAMRTKAEANDRVVPGALLHNMACKKITIAPDLSGCAEIIRHGDNGFLFKADDQHDFCAVLENIMENWTMYEAVRENAYRDIQENYSLAATASKYADAIEHFSNT